MDTQPLHPAPGSAVPGAPPALRRDLTAQDGVTAPPPTITTPPAPSVAVDPNVPAHRFARTESPVTADRFLTALGFISVAVAIEVGTRRTRALFVHRAANKELS